MASVAHFLRCVRISDMKEHLALLGVDTISIADAHPINVPMLHGLLSNREYDRLVADAERILAMTDEVGLGAMRVVPGYGTQLEAIDGACHRAHRLFLQSPEAFRRAEEIRYADEHQNAHQLWNGFIGPKGREVLGTEANLAAFGEKLKPILSKDRIHIDTYERARERDGGNQEEVMQVTIYSEGVPEDEIVFGQAALENRTRKPVRETTIIYEPETGTIEVVGQQRQARAEIAVVFAAVLLGTKIKAERLAPRSYDLLPLLDSHSFPTQPGDGIARVKLTKLVCSTNDDRLVQMFRVPFKDEASLYDVVKEQYGDDNPLDGDLNPWSACIEVQFEPEAHAKKGKKIAFTITAPNKCSLRGKTARERRILTGHLKAWCLTVD